MHIDSSSTKSKDGQVYTRHLLRQSIRDGRKVNKRTIANLSHCSPEEIVAIKLALRNKHDLSQVGSLSKDVEVHQGTSFGATYVLKNIAERLGLIKALGQSEDGKLALWQVIARLMNQGSRLSAVRLAEQQSAVPILDMEAFNEDDLYRNLDWISDHQSLFEQSLYEHRYKKHEEFFFTTSPAVTWKAHKMNSQVGVQSRQEKWQNDHCCWAPMRPARNPRVHRSL